MVLAHRDEGPERRSDCRRISRRIRLYRTGDAVSRNGTHPFQKGSRERV